MSTFSDMPLSDFLAQAASDAPTPGGGGVAALAGALGAAMASMAANFTVGRPKYAEHDNFVRSTLDRLGPLVDSLRGAIDADAEAFLDIGAAYRLPRETDEDKSRRNAAIQAALTGAMRVPREIIRQCADAATFLPKLAEVGNPNLVSDVEVAAVMLDAAAKTARINVRVNAEQLRNAEATEAMAEADDLVARIAGIAGETAANAAKRREG